MIIKPDTYGFPEDMWNELPDEIKKAHIEHHERAKDQLKNDIMNDFNITEHDWNSMRASVKMAIQSLYREVDELTEQIQAFRDWYEDIPI